MRSPTKNPLTGLQPQPVDPSVALVWLALCVVLASCAPKREVRVPTVAELAADPIVLSRVVAKCNESVGLATSQECLNARGALVRRARETGAIAEEAARAAAAQLEFERLREERRARDAAKRQPPKPPADPYTMPIEPAR